MATFRLFLGASAYGASTTQRQLWSMMVAAGCAMPLPLPVVTFGEEDCRTLLGLYGWVEAPTGGGLKWWTGAAWATGVLKWWTGATWDTGVLKRWTGSEWVE